MDFPTDLIEAFDPHVGEGVVAFVGSGPSCHAGLPNWPELLRRIAAEINAESLVEPYLARGQFDKVAQFLARERSERDIKERAVKQIKRATRTPSPIHELIVKIPFAGIITTNYDLLLTTADNSKYFNLPITHQNTGLRDHLRSHFLLHLHGHVNEPETIVLTRQGYDQIEMENERVRRFLSTVFQKFVVLFIGFGFADDHVDYLLREFKDIEAMDESSVFALIPSTSSLDVVQEQNLRFRFINPIFLADHGDHGVAELLAWLESLHNALKQINLSYHQSVQALGLGNVLERLQSLFISDEWLPLLANTLSTLPNRPDIRNLVRIGFTKADVENVFRKLGLSEMRATLIALNTIKHHQILEDALSCFPPIGNENGT